MAAIIRGTQRAWGGKRDHEGHRTYTVEHRVTALVTEGPNAVMFAAGLPTIGSLWNFDDDTDVWAFCYPDRVVSPFGRKEGPNREWTVKDTFGTRPLTRCQDESIEDPLLEPDRLSGGSMLYTEEATKDRHGNLIASSSHEMIRGPQVEFDNHKGKIRVEQNVAELERDVLEDLINHVNDEELWGSPARCVKFSTYTWQRKVWGICDYYYVRTLEFDIDDDTFDRELVDEGTKCLRGHWDDSSPPTYVIAAGVDEDNPQHFIRYKDPYGENARVILNGYGLPADTMSSEGTGTSEEATGPPGTIDVEKYDEDDLTLLGIPTEL